MPLLRDVVTAVGIDLEGHGGNSGSMDEGRAIHVGLHVRICRPRRLWGRAALASYREEPLSEGRPAVCATLPRTPATGSVQQRASIDKTARVWDAEAGNQIAICKGHDARVRHAAFSPDGARILTASDDGTARFYSAWRDEKELIAFAKSRVTRGLTQAQRIANYLELPVAEGAADNTIPPSPFGPLGHS